MQLKNLKFQVLIFMLSVNVTTSITWADGYKEVYPNLSTKVEYSYTYYDKTGRTTKGIQQEIYDLIIIYYSIPEKLKEKLVLQKIFEFDDQFLIGVYIRDERNAVKFPLEAKTYKEIAAKNCNEVSQHFKSFCALRRSIKPRSMVIVNLKKHTVIPLPESIKVSSVKQPSIDIEKFDFLAKNSISSFDNQYIYLIDVDFPRFFKDLIFAFDGAAISHDCLVGKFGVADVNGDGVNDLLVIGDRVRDDSYEWQVENKIFAYARVYVLAIDISQGIAKPIFQEELFAYEMDYKGQSEGIGDGIVREARIFWGDFNNDGKYDYLVRRKQADISTNFGGLTRSWTTQNVVKKAVLYEGSTDGYRKSQYNDEKFLKYIQENTNWDEGFLQPNNCK